MTTDYYLSEIDRRSNRFGDKLKLLLKRTNKPFLFMVTYDEAKAFYEELVRKENDNK